MIPRYVYFLTWYCIEKKENIVFFTLDKNAIIDKINDDNKVLYVYENVRFGSYSNSLKDSELFDYILFHSKRLFYPERADLHTTLPNQEWIPTTYQLIHRNTFSLRRNKNEYKGKGERDIYFSCIVNYDPVGYDEYFEIDFEPIVHMDSRKSSKIEWEKEIVY